MARNPDGRGKTRPGGTLSPEDAALFEATLRDVKALDRRARTVSPPAPDRQAASRPKATPRPRPPAGKATPARLPTLVAGESADVDTRTMDRLRRGRLRPDARIDLHGMTQDNAHRALIAFIGRAQADGARCVIVVTGKGRISEGGGILRNQVPQWLNSPALRPLILAFAPTQPRDGGDGALYVLLRRRR